VPNIPPNAPAEIPIPPVSVLIEKADEKRYTIRTSDLGYIASQLRGQRPFSVFNSIILPILVVVGTTLVTTAVGSLFQYVSWRNSIKVQEASDRANSANMAYGKASIAIGKRYYSTFLYLAAVRDLANLKSANNHLYQFNLDLNRRRFDAFYQQLRDWNETYDQILTEIDFSMDRPVQIAEHVRNAKLATIDCGQTLIEQIQLHGMNATSSKIQFAAINHCFFVSTSEFSAQKDEAVKDPTFIVDEQIKTKVNEALYAVNAMANEFRCHALLRIQYFNQLKEEAIFKPIDLFKNATRGWWDSKEDLKGFDFDAVLARRQS
jgi:hypothetical protein